MGTITTGVGLVSGIDIESIVEQLMAIESRPRAALANRQAEVDAQRTAVMDVSSSILSLKMSITSLRTSRSLSAATATSSNSSLLSATASNGAVAGTYQFKVARLVSTQQLLSAGVSNSSTTKLGAGTITIQSAKARLVDDTRLDVLNGQAGVRLGSIRITDRSGATAVVDLSTALTVNDVLDAINSNTTVSVIASADGGRLVLEDATGQTTANLAVSEVGVGTTASDLGIRTSVAASTLTGTDLISVSASTSLDLLNQGNGVSTVAGSNDLRITLRDGTTMDVNLSGAVTLGAVIDAINAASQASANPGALVASINTAGDGIRLTDSSAGGTLTVTALNGSRAASDLGLLSPDTAASGDDVIVGRALMGGLTSVLLGTLKGGQGISRGTFSITDRNGASDTVALSSANTIQDVIDAINASSAGVTARLNDSQNGIIITDTTGGSGNLVVADVSGTAASDLGITIDAAAGSVASGDLNRQFITERTHVDDLNGGAGIKRGKFTITNSLGQTATVDLTQGNEQTLADVIDEINSKGISVTARINDTGDGLILEDTAGGAGLLAVADTSGTSAADLGIAGTAATGTTYIDGSSAVSIEVTANDTLSSLVTKINSSGANVRAAIFNDGSTVNPYRLSLVSKSSGAEGALLVDMGSVGLSVSEVVRGADAVLSVGDVKTANPVLISSGSNTVTGVIPNVTLDLLQAAPSTTVSITVATDAAGVYKSLNGLATAFNTVTAKIANYTKYDTETQTGAILQGDGGMLAAQSRLFSMLYKRFDTGSQFTTLASIGFKVNSGGKLELDQDRFNEVFADDPDGVRKLLTDTTSGALVTLQSTVSSLAETGSGSLWYQANRLADQSSMYQTRLDSMDKLLDAKRERLTNSFIAMETALSQMQAQLTAISNLSQLASSWVRSSSGS